MKHLTVVFPPTKDSYNTVKLKNLPKIGQAASAVLLPIRKVKNVGKDVVLTVTAGFVLQYNLVDNIEH